jgi:hypothetical protein
VTHVILLGEGTFHQHHYGITMSSRSIDVINLLDKYHDQYKEIRKSEFTSPKTNPVFVGNIPDSVLPFIQESIVNATDNNPTCE